MRAQDGVKVSRLLEAASGNGRRKIRDQVIEEDGKDPCKLWRGGGGVRGWFLSWGGRGGGGDVGGFFGWDLQSEAGASR